MATLSWVPRLNFKRTVAQTPTITSGSAYAAGNQLGGIMTFANVIRQETGLQFSTCKLMEVTVLDADKQNSAIDIWLFNQSPTVTSADKQAFAMTAANQAAQCIGVVTIGSTTYSSAAAVSTATAVNLQKFIHIPGTVANPANVYAIAIVRGTPTYTTTTSVQFQFSFEID